jgi:hypothetical protein
MHSLKDKDNLVVNPGVNVAVYCREVRLGSSWLKSARFKPADNGSKVPFALEWSRFVGPYKKRERERERERSFKVVSTFREALETSSCRHMTSRRLRSSRTANRIRTQRKTVSDEQLKPSLVRNSFSIAQDSIRSEQSELGVDDDDDE